MILYNWCCKLIYILQSPTLKRSNGYPQRNGRQDSMRSGYLSDQENRTKMLQQISVESAQSQDSRLCYLTSSEVTLEIIRNDT